MLNPDPGGLASTVICETMPPWRSRRIGRVFQSGAKEMAMISRLGWCFVLCGLGAWASPGRADQFEQLDGPTLVRTLKGADVTARASLTVSDIGAMPPLLRDTRSALVLASTD